MAKISDTKGRLDSNSGYSRLFGNNQLGQLMSRVHATVIRTGNELEHILRDNTPEQYRTTLDTVLENQQTSPIEFIQVVFQCKMPETSKHKGITVDVAIFDHYQRRVSAIELKDGDTFDTKKSSGELESMTTFTEWISRQTGYEARYYFCSFNQDNKEAIVSGAKGRFAIDHAMTGRELCNLLDIDFDLIRKQRQSEQKENLSFFVDQLLEIPEIRVFLEKFLSKRS